MQCSKTDIVVIIQAQSRYVRACVILTWLELNYVPEALQLYIEGSMIKEKNAR